MTLMVMVMVMVKFMVNTFHGQYMTMYMVIVSFESKSTV
jgi:hypothetical protein